MGKIGYLENKVRNEKLTYNIINGYIMGIIINNINCFPKQDALIIEVRKSSNNYL